MKIIIMIFFKTKKLVLLQRVLETRKKQKNFFDCLSLGVQSSIFNYQDNGRLERKNDKKEMKKIRQEKIFVIYFWNQGTIHFVAVLRVGALLRIHPVPSRRRPPLQAARAVPPAPSHKARSPRMRSHPKSVPKPPCIEASASARVPDDRYGTHPGTIAHLHVSRRWCSRRRHRGRRDSTPSMDELEARRRQVSLSEYCYAAHSPPVRSDFQLTSS